MMRAKMQVRSVERPHENYDMERLTMAAVCGNAPYGPNGESEDNAFARFTPAGSLTLDITNPALHGKFTRGQTFYMDFTPAAEDPKPSPTTALSVREMQAINAQRSARWMAGSPGWTTLEIAGELAGEVGELANVCKKLRRSEMGVPGNKVSDEVLFQQARGEMADVMIVLMLTASKLGIDLQDAVCATFNAKSEQMGFPERL